MSEEKKLVYTILKLRADEVQKDETKSAAYKLVMDDLFDESEKAPVDLTPMVKLTEEDAALLGEIPFHKRRKAAPVEVNLAFVEGVEVDEELLPVRKTKGAAAVDLKANISADKPVVLNPGEIRGIGTGVCVAIPEGFEGQVRTRSGLGAKGIVVSNSPGTIDSDYRGEIKIILHHTGSRTFQGELFDQPVDPQPFTIKRYDRIAQLVIAAVPLSELVVVEGLDETERGSGGLGSTGVAK